MEQALPVTEALSPPASRAWYAGLKESLNLLDDEQLKKFATIAHYSFKSIDLCCFILIELEKRKVIEKDSFKKYVMNSKKFI